MAGGKLHYSAKKASKLSAEETAKYKEIAAAVSAKGKDKSADPKAAIEKIESCLAKVAEDNGLSTEAETFDTSDSDFVGIVLCGEVVSGGELKVDVDDVYVEEPREVAEDEEVEDEEERSLWGDGDKDPAEADED
uniref:Uncharacterized protein n=1 Tax=Alexandrium monilatum TaxID=311494 RepID=A0A7S4VZN2_9DINO